MTVDDMGSTPSSDLAAPPPSSAAAPAPPDEVIANLAAASGWVQFMAVLGFISVALMGLAGLVILVIGLPDTGIVGHFLGFMYLVMGAIYLVPLLPLNRAAQAASRLKAAPSHATAVEILHQQAIFWRRLGILTIVAISLGILFGLILVPVAWLAK
jgi:hypothetical protein